MKVHKIVQDFQLKILAYQKVYLIPAPPRKPSPIFIQLLNLERPKLGQLQKIHSSVDLVSMMSQEWKTYDPIRKAQLQRVYDREIILYFQNMQKYIRIFDNSIRILSTAQQYQRIQMSEQFKHDRTDDDGEEQLRVIRQNFGNLQTSLQNTQKNITQQDKKLVQQLIHLKSQLKQQILTNYLHFKIPNFFLNSYGKTISNDYFHTYIKQYEKVPEEPFQKYLTKQKLISEHSLLEYQNQLEYLSKQLNCQQENVELALVFHLNYKKKIKQKKKEKKNDFLELVEQEMGSIDIE